MGELRFHQLGQVLTNILSDFDSGYIYDSRYMPKAILEALILQPGFLVNFKGFFVRALKGDRGV